MNDLEEKAKTVQCPECEGTGLRKGTKGSYRVFQLDKQLLEALKCKFCKGKGKVDMVLVSVAQQEIDDCKASWQNLKDTIPKFDAKISFLETHLEACNKLIDEMQRERGLLKQKLQQIAVEIENLRRHNRYNAETDKWQIPQRQLFALEKKFEELLK
jgi:RecJ-like exonuclease